MHSGKLLRAQKANSSQHSTMTDTSVYSPREWLENQTLIHSDSEGGQVGVVKPGEMLHLSEVEKPFGQDNKTSPIIP